MFAKREAEWDRERRAREKLMEEVFEERRIQLEEKMDRLRQAQAESMAQREELLRNIEQAEAETARQVCPIVVLVDRASFLTLLCF